MIKISFTRKLLIAALAIFIFIPESGYSIHVTFFLGDVKLIRSGRTIKVNMGDIVKSGDMIKTGKGATITLNYKDGSKITIQQNSTARIGSKGIKGSENVSLVSGNLSGKFTKLAKGGKSKRVYGPTIVCAIRGTEFKMGVSKGGDSRVDLAEGKLNIKNPYGSTPLKQNQNVQAGVGSKPAKGSRGSMTAWKNSRDNDLKRNPGGRGKQYGRYIQTFNNQNQQDSKNMGKYNNMVKSAKKADDIKKAGSEINDAEQNIEDNLMLNETASSSIEGVMNDYKSRNRKIYDQFLKLKKESNKVAEQQRKNYEAIQAVKEEYRKAYEKIIGKFQDDRDKILKGVDFNKLKPKLKND
jgi:hypothetical protein